MHLELSQVHLRWSFFKKSVKVGPSLSKKVCFIYLNDKKGKVILKFNDVTTWLTNSYNTRIAQSLKEKEPDNETWLGNRIEQEKYFSSKIMKKIRQGY